MPWWAWLVLGSGLLAAEVVAPTDFWLAMPGAAALVLGVAVAVGLEPPASAQWLGFAVLAIALTLTVRQRLRGLLAGRAEGLGPELVGERGTSREAMAPGALGSVEVRGTAWRARNVGAVALGQGDPICVERVEGLRLDVRG